MNDASSSGAHSEGGPQDHPWARPAYTAAVTSYFALIALLLAWIVWLEPPPTSLISPALLIILGPLLIPLRGILHARRYTMAWSTMLILAYFVHGVAYAAGSGPAVWLGVGEIALALIYFSGTNAYLRVTRAPRAPRE